MLSSFASYKGVWKPVKMLLGENCEPTSEDMTFQQMVGHPISISKCLKVVLWLFMGKKLKQRNKIHWNMNLTTRRQSM